MKRLLITMVGVAATVLAIIGVLLPGVPTTIFVLVALWAFSQVSSRLENAFMRIPILKSAIGEAKRFQAEGTVSFSSKVISQSCSWVSFVGIAAFYPQPVLLVAIGLLAVSCSLFMWWVPTAAGSPELNQKA